MKKKEVLFSVHERRILGLPIKEKIYGKDAEALRKIIDVFPGMLIVADQGFDPLVKAAMINVWAASANLDIILENKKNREKK